MNSDIEAVIEVHNHEIALVSVVETRRQIFLSRSGFPVALQLGAPVRREILDHDVRQIDDSNYWHFCDEDLPAACHVHRVHH